MRLILRVYVLSGGEEFLADNVYDLAVNQFYQALEDDDGATTADRANRDLYRLTAHGSRQAPQTRFSRDVVIPGRV